MRATGRRMPWDYREIQMARCRVCTVMSLVLVIALAGAATAQMRPIDLGTLGGAQSMAVGLNDQGTVVGFSYLADDFTVHGFVWTAREGMRDVGTLGGRYSVASAVNDAGD